MRLAVIGDELSQDPELVAGTAARLGFAGVEIRSLEETPPNLLSDEQVARVRALLEANGLEVAGFAPPVFKCALPRTDEELAAVSRVLIESCQRAALLGAPQMRIFTFIPDGDPDPVLAARTTASLLAGVQLPVAVTVETGTRTNTPTVRHVLAYLDELGRDDIGILWDPGNSVFSGWDPAPFPGDYLLGKERITHVHVKDPDGTRGYVRMGDGDLDWEAILARLAEDGYSGFVSLETHWRIGRQMTAAERAEPWGEVFSRGGYEASVECMRRIRRWADQLSPDAA